VVLRGTHRYDRLAKTTPDLHVQGRNGTGCHPKLRRSSPPSDTDDCPRGRPPRSVADDDMLHALQHHWRAFETDDPAVTIYIGPATNAEPLEIGVVDDEDEEGIAVIHAMPARSKFLRGWWSP